jgi:hypothetical protein
MDSKNHCPKLRFVLFYVPALSFAALAFDYLLVLFSLFDMAPISCSGVPGFSACFQGFSGMLLEAAELATGTRRDTK